jgi:hypothetical protein
MAGLTALGKDLGFGVDIQGTECELVERQIVDIIKKYDTRWCCRNDIWLTWQIVGTAFCNTTFCNTTFRKHNLS